MTVKSQQKGRNANQGEREKGGKGLSKAQIPWGHDEGGFVAYQGKNVIRGIQET